MKKLKNIARRVRFYLINSDLKLWTATITAILYSLLLIASMQRSGGYNYLKTQLIALFIGFFAAVIISNADYIFLIKKWYVFTVIAALLSLLVFIFGIRVSGTDDTAWISVFGYTVQPSEFIKICFIITLTRHLSYLKEKEYLNNLWGLLSLCFHAAVPMVIIHLQGDDGTVLIFGLVFLIMCFMSGIMLRYFAMFTGALAATVPVIWNFLLNDEHRNRLSALLFPGESTVTDYGWQQYQGKLSVACGGLFGIGLFNGTRVKNGIVPEQENDFIFTVAGEELGFIGCIIILVLLLIIILRVIQIAKRAADYSGRLICAGVFALIASQTIINLGMVLGFFPVIGVTLPLFSSGGSSLMSVLICIGLVQSVYSNKINRG